MRIRIICYSVLLLGLCSLVVSGTVVVHHANGARTLGAIEVSLEEVMLVPTSEEPLAIVVRVSGGEGLHFNAHSLFLTLKVDGQTVGIRTPWPLTLEFTGSPVLLTVPLDPGWDFADRRSLEQLLPVNERTWVMSGELGVTVPHARRPWTVEFSTTREGT